jgi:hypothetical protein
VRPEQVLGFSWWNAAQVRLRDAPRRVRFATASAVLVAGVWLRFWVASFPYNYDFESYLIVSSTVLDGGNPYETNRYNYGPAWFIVLALIRSVASEPEAFRFGIVALLTLVDIGIGVVLWRRGLPVAAMLFFVLQVTVSISGNHHQFDNIAVLLALVASSAVARSRDPSQGNGSRQVALAVGLLSLSLIVKHVFIVYPLWLAFQERGLKRYLFLLVPPSVWLASLFPFLLDAPRAVLDNVFFYQSFNNAPLAYLLLPEPFVRFLGENSLLVLLFLGPLTMAGYLYRSLPPFDSVLVYTVMSLLLSSAVADQYFAIPAAATAVFLNAGFLLWMLGATTYLWGVGSATAVSLPLLAYPSVALGKYFPYHVVPFLVGWFILHRQLTGLSRVNGQEAFLDRALRAGGLGSPTHVSTSVPRGGGWE